MPRQVKILKHTRIVLQKLFDKKELGIFYIFDKNKTKKNYQF